jgi:hypothetical protein
MKRLIFGVALALVCSCAFGYAQSLPSSKTAIKLSDVALIDATAGPTGWVNLLNTSIKTSEQKDLVLGVSLETGLFTRTLVKSKGGTTDTQWAWANVEVQVLVDGKRVASPGVVTFDKRYQELMAKLGGILNCVDTDGDGHMDYNECTLSDEEIQLVLDTMAAHHFNFALTELGAGEHAVQLQARVTTNTSGLQASATGAVGKGSLTVEEVRLVKGAIIMQ